MFLAGGLVLWTLLGLSIATFACAFERGWFWFQLTSQEDRVVHDVLEAAPQNFEKGLTKQGLLAIANNPVTEAQLSQQMQAYLQTNHNGAVVLEADRQLSYEQVVQTLGKMRDVGGDRVSLAIDPN